MSERKQVGMVDGELLARVDARAAVLGQTRRVFVERALEAALGRAKSEAGAVAAARAIVADEPGRFSEGVVRTAREVLEADAQKSRREVEPLRGSVPLSGVDRAAAFRRASQKR